MKSRKTRRKVTFSAGHGANTDSNSNSREIPIASERESDSEVERRRKRPLSTSPLPSKGLDVDGIKEIPLSPENNVLHNIPKVIIDTIETKRPKLVLPASTELMSIVHQSADLTEPRSMLPLSLQTECMHDAMADLNVTADSGPVDLELEFDTCSDTDENTKILDKSDLDVTDFKENCDFSESEITSINVSSLKMYYDKEEGHTPFLSGFPPATKAPSPLVFMFRTQLQLL